VAETKSTDSADSSRPADGDSIRVLPRHTRKGSSALAKWIRADRVRAILVVILVAGAILRLLFVVQWRPGLTGYSDSGIYFQGGVQGAFTDPIRTVGYTSFLIFLHWITPHLLPVIIVQHLLGLLTAVLFYAAVRRCGAPAALGLAPAAILALGGMQLFLEHSALSETLFTLLIAVMCYCAIRAWRGNPAWAALAGAGAGFAVTMRGAGSILVPVVAVWLFFGIGRPSWRTSLCAALALGSSVAVVGGYVGLRHHDTGLSGITTNDVWNLYGRVAPFADCTRFTPPAGTQLLCDPTPPSERLGRFPEHGPGPGPGGDRKTGQSYIYDTDSPAVRLFGPPYYVSSVPHATRELRDWSIAVIKGQPLDYIDAVWQDTIRLVVPNHRSFGELSPDETVAFIVGGPDLTSGKNVFVQSWQTQFYPHDAVRHGNITFMRDWESVTRVDGLWMLAALLLAAGAPLLVPSSARAPAALFMFVAFALIWFPILTTGYNYRFVIPALGPLIAAAAFGAWGLARRLHVPERWSSTPAAA
jgi:Dolichyl-phosphate-mannose-protein mannosyltransferase